MSRGTLGGPDDVEGSRVERLAWGRGCWMFWSKEFLGTCVVSRAFAAATLAMPLISKVLISSVSDWLKPVAGTVGCAVDKEVEGTMTEGVACADVREELVIGEAREEEVCIDIGITGP